MISERDVVMSENGTQEYNESWNGQIVTSIPQSVGDPSGK